jgi:hypothetical protein
MALTGELRLGSNFACPHCPKPLLGVENRAAGEVPGGEDGHGPECPVHNRQPAHTGTENALAAVCGVRATALTQAKTFLLVGFGGLIVFPFHAPDCHVPSFELTFRVAPTRRFTGSLPDVPNR